MMATANASSSQITANLFAPAGSGNGIMATPGVPVTTAMPSYPYAPIAAPIAPMSSSNMMKMMRPPSVASSDQGSVRGCSKKARSKRNRCASEVSENEDEGTGRKLNRNKREQQRSQQITSQITNLKKVLVDANVQFKPDKYSTLVSVVDYVKQLQQRSKILDSEHSKLLDTINKTSEIVNSQQLAPSVTSALSDSCTGLSNDLLSDGTISPLCEDEAMVMVRGLDYKAVFGSCPLAFSIASVDGRFLDCNREFEKVTGYTRKHLLTDRTTTGPEQGSDSDITASDSESGGVSPSQKNGKNKSLFNILNHDDAGIRGVFTAMSEMLRRPVLDGSSSADIVSSEDCWTEEVGMGRLEKKVCVVLLIR
jgi:PAS domain-containing protein